MQQRHPLENTGNWTFDLQQEPILQFRIASEQETTGQILIEGHDVSVLLDYLYAHRDLIYEASHDQERRHLEAQEAREAHEQRRTSRQKVTPVLYFDNGDGTQRRRINL